MERNSRMSLAAFYGAVVFCISATLVTRPAQADSVYTFEGLRNNDLAGQDGWKYFAGQGVGVTPGAGSDTSNVAYAPDLGGGADTRTNDANFSFQAFTGAETAAVLQYDVRIDPNTNYYNYFSDTGFAVGNRADIGPTFGIVGTGKPNAFYIREAAFGNFYYGSLPPNVADGDWLRLRLTLNFTAHGGDGAGSLEYEDLTTGTSFTPIAALQGIDLKLSNMSTGPSAWNEMYVRIEGPGLSADNLSPNVTTAAPLPSSSFAGAVLFACLGISRLRRWKFGQCRHGTDPLA